MQKSRTGAVRAAASSAPARCRGPVAAGKDQKWAAASCLHGQRRPGDDWPRARACTRRGGGARRLLHRRIAVPHRKAPAAPLRRNTPRPHLPSRLANAPRSKGKKGGKKKAADPFSKKDWYDVKAPSMFAVRQVGKTLVTRTQGTKVRPGPGNLRVVRRGGSWAARMQVMAWHAEVLPTLTYCSAADRLGWPQGPRVRDVPGGSAEGVLAGRALRLHGAVPAAVLSACSSGAHIRALKAPQKPALLWP